MIQFLDVVVLLTTLVYLAFNWKGQLRAVEVSSVPESLITAAVVLLAAYLCDIIGMSLVAAVEILWAASYLIKPVRQLLQVFRDAKKPS